jgi:hypothetical protein
LFGRGADVAVRIAAVDRVEPLEWGENPESLGSYGPGGRIWHRFARLADGSWLAINLDANKHLAPWRSDPVLSKRRDQLGYSVFAPICHGSDATRNQPDRNPVVALSFTELLGRLLDSGGKPFWLAAGFTGYGDAELYTRRT